MTVTADSIMSASVKSSKPYQCNPPAWLRARSARMTPNVTRFWLEKMAVGGSSAVSSSSAASRADSSIMESVADRNRGCRNAGPAQLLDEAATPLPGGLDVRPVSQTGKFGMAVRQEVGRGPGGSDNVVRHHGVRLNAHRLAVNEHHGQIAGVSPE